MRQFYLARRLARGIPSSGSFTRSALASRSSASCVSGFSRRGLSTLPTPPAGGLAAFASESHAKIKDIASSAEEHTHNLGLSAGELFSTVEPTAFWWNTSLAMDAVNALHLSAGMPYWLSIVALTAGVRAAMIPLTVIQFRNTAKLANANPEIQKVMEKTKAKQKSGNFSASDQVQMSTDLKQVYDKHQVHPLKGMAMPLAQAPIFMTFFFALRGMAERYPEICNGGALWFTDLSAPDPYFVLPVLSAATMFATFELTSMDNKGSPQADKMKPFMRGFCVLIAPISAWFPASLLTYWVTSNTMSMLITGILRVPAVKALCNIPDRIVPNSDGSYAPPRPTTNPTAPRPKTFNSPPSRKAAQKRSSNKRKGRSK